MVESSIRENWHAEGRWHIPWETLACFDAQLGPEGGRTKHLFQPEPPETPARPIRQAANDSRIPAMDTHRYSAQRFLPEAAEFYHPVGITRPLDGVGVVRLPLLIRDLRGDGNALPLVPHLTPSTLTPSTDFF